MRKYIIIIATLSFCVACNQINYLGGVRLKVYSNPRILSEAEISQVEEVIDSRISDYHGSSYYHSYDAKYKYWTMDFAGAESSPRLVDLTTMKGELYVYEQISSEELNTVLDSVFLIDTLQQYLDYATTVSHYSAANIIAQVSKEDTSKVNKLLRVEEIRSKFPLDVIFLWGRIRGGNKFSLFPAISTEGSIGRENIENCHFQKKNLDTYSLVFELDEVGKNKYETMVKRSVFNRIYICLDNTMYFDQVTTDVKDFSSIHFGKFLSHEHAIFFMAMANNPVLDIELNLHKVYVIDK